MYKNNKLYNSTIIEGLSSGSQFRFRDSVIMGLRYCKAYVVINKWLDAEPLGFSRYLVPGTEAT